MGVLFSISRTHWKLFTLPRKNVTFTEVCINCIVFSLINEISVNGPYMLHYAN